MKTNKELLCIFFLDQFMKLGLDAILFNGPVMQQQVLSRFYLNWYSGIKKIFISIKFISS